MREKNKITKAIKGDRDRGTRKAYKKKAEISIFIDALHTYI